MLGFLERLLGKASPQPAGKGTIITGVVDASGMLGGRIVAGGSRTSAFTLAVWQQDGDAPQTEGLRVEIRNIADERAVNQLKRTIQPRKALAFSLARWDATPYGKRLAVLGELFPTPDAPELLALADPILNPPPFVDPEFGTFTSVAYAPEWYEQEVSWMGQELRVRLVKGDKQLEDCIATMRKLWSEQESWDRRTREAVANDIFANDHDWLQGTPAETREGLMASLSPLGLSVFYDGSFTIDYVEKEDLELFGGHMLIVEASLDDGVRHVSMEG